MGKVVNLNRFRKQKAKAERAQRADVNRRLHGRTKAERAREALQKKQLTKAVEGARLEAVSSEAASSEAASSEGQGPSVEDGAEERQD
jgi:hypothetical protein